MTEQVSPTAGPDEHRPDPDGPAPRPETTATLAEFVAIACLRGWCHESRVCPICSAYRHNADEVEHLREVAAHGQTLAIEVGSLREEVEHLRALGGRRCQVCGATMQADERGLLPDHEVGEGGRCPASRTDDHEPASISPWVSPEPSRAVVDAEVARVAREVARGWVAGLWSSEERVAEVMRLLCAAVGVTEPDGAPQAGVGALLAEFHEAIGQPFGHGNVNDSALRRKLHDDEHAELLAALDAADLPAVAHELADVVYVAYGSAHSLGIPLDDVIAEVHRSNRTRTLRPDGKMVKGPGYRPPDVAAVLASRTATPPPAEPEHCPRCDSPQPRLHPAVQHGGEVQPCPHPWHHDEETTGRGGPPMSAESPAVLLRRAADHLDELAKGATTKHGAWLADHTLPGDEACVMVVTNAEKGWAQILFAADWGTDADARWIAALSPVVAAPLAAWLRAEAHLADLCDARPDPIAEQLGIDQAALAPFDSPAVALARALLGETETRGDH